MSPREKCNLCGKETACDVCGAPSDTCWDTHYEGSCGDGVCSTRACANYGKRPPRAVEGIPATTISKEPT